jgi:phosphohistidine phosphatase
MPGRELVLLRHAKAEDEAASDFERTLTDTGKAQAERMGRQLLRQGLKPDKVVTSPAARTWETALLACRELGIPESAIAKDKAVYDAEVVQLLQVIERHGGDAQRFMLVGHNPGLTDLGAYLAKPVPAGWGLAKGAAAHLSLDGEWKRIGKSHAQVVRVLEP